MKTELARLSDQILVWSRYDPAIKADLSATAIATAIGTVVIDPIEMECTKEIEALGDLVAVLVSNANHARAAQAFATRFRATIFAPDQLRDALPEAKSLSDSAPIHGIDVFSIEGAAPGELAFYDPRAGGTIVVGDALINFGRDGFCLLPRKYCVDQKRMVRSLHKLLALEFQRILFAHGEPVVCNAHERLAKLLENE